MTVADEHGHRRSPHVRSVERAARIITALAEHPYPMGVIELAARVHLSPGSVHRMLTTLVRIGWVEQNARSARYRLGIPLLGIGSTGLITHPIVQNGKVYLQRMADLTGHDAVLSTLVGARTVHLARVQGRRGRATAFEPGVSQPAHAMADGKLLLAYLPEAERAYLYRTHGLRRYTPQTIVEPAALERELAAIRSQGYATDRGERFEAVSGVAVPILDAYQQPLLGMLCIGKFTLTAEHEAWLRQRMLSLAQELSDQLTLIGDLPKASVDFARYNFE